MTKIYKRILSPVLVVCMLFSIFSAVAYADGSGAFVPGQYEATAGENIEVDLNVTGTRGVVVLVCEVVFDGEYLEILRYDDANLFGGSLTAKTDESPMRLFWMDALAEDNIVVNGTLGTFTFKALKSGTTKIDVICAEAYTMTGEQVSFEKAEIDVSLKESDVPVEEIDEYTITATAGKNGKITPSGEVKAMEGKQVLFVFTADSGYKVADVLVDGESVGAVLEYTYEAVSADSEIEVVFEKINSSGGSSSGSSSSSSGSSSSSSGRNPSSSGGSSSSDKIEKEPSTEPADKEETTPKDETPKEESKEDEKAQWVNPFTDVKTDDWFYENVKYINDKKLMYGISDSEFAPDGSVTRAMFVAVLHRLEKEPSAPKADFADVPENAYYEKAVGWAVESGLVYGVSETEFAPDATITREQMAAIIHRYMKFKGLDMSIDEKTDITLYEDFENISDFAREAFGYACSKGIISGTSQITLSPKESATRAQMAAIFQRCENVLLNQ